jgi:hypothetical protein
MDKVPCNAERAGQLVSGFSQPETFLFVKKMGIKYLVRIFLPNEFIQRGKWKWMFGFRFGC